MGTSMSNPIVAERERLNLKARVLTAYAQQHSSLDNKVEKRGTSQLSRSVSHTPRFPRKY